MLLEIRLSAGEEKEELGSRIASKEAIEALVFLWSKSHCNIEFFSEANAPLDSVLQFPIQSKSRLLTVTQMQVCFRVDSWCSDMDHRQTPLAGLEQLEHLVRFQKLIWVDYLLPFQKKNKPWILDPYLHHDVSTMHLFLSIKYGDKGIKEIKSTAPSLEIQFLT